MYDDPDVRAYAPEYLLELAVRDNGEAFATAAGRGYVQQGRGSMIIYLGGWGNKYEYAHFRNLTPTEQQALSAAEVDVETVREQVATYDPAEEVVALLFSDIDEFRRRRMAQEPERFDELKDEDWSVEPHSMILKPDPSPAEVTPGLEGVLAMRTVLHGLRAFQRTAQ